MEQSEQNRANARAPRFGKRANDGRDVALDRALSDLGERGTWGEYAYAFSRRTGTFYYVAPEGTRNLRMLMRAPDHTRRMGRVYVTARRPRVRVRPDVARRGTVADSFYGWRADVFQQRDAHADAERARLRARRDGVTRYPPAERVREPRVKRAERVWGVDVVAHAGACTRAHATVSQARACTRDRMHADALRLNAYADTVARINARERLRSG